jgi:hypothetical protein
MDCTENTASSSSSILACVLIDEGTWLLRECLAMATSSGYTILAFRNWGWGDMEDKVISYTSIIFFKIRDED